MSSIKLLFSAVVLSFGLNAVVANAQVKDVHSMEPKHGGVVSESNHMEFELVVKPEFVALYATDHEKAVEFENAKAKVILLDEGKKSEHTLIGNGAALRGEGINLKGKSYTALATIEFANKRKLTVRFKSK